MESRIALGREAVVREIRAAAPLMADLRAPVTARAPWLTAVLNAGATRRPVAVAVSRRPGDRPDGVAFLTVRRRGVATTVTLLGSDAAPAPGGAPPSRLLARDDEVAGRLAESIVDLLHSLRGPWNLQMSGLPLGDPTLRALAGHLPTALVANGRSERLVDELDAVADVERARDPRTLERRLPALLDRLPDRRARTFLRCAARLHAAMGQLEVAVVAEGEALRVGLLTLVDGSDRRTWWGTSDVGGLRSELGTPLVRLTVPAFGMASPAAGQRAR